MLKKILILSFSIVIICCKKEVYYIDDCYSIDIDNKSYIGKLIDYNGLIKEYDAIAVSNVDLIYNKLFTYIKLKTYPKLNKSKKIFLYLFVNYSDKTYNNIKINICGLNKNYERINNEDIVEIISNSKSLEYFFKIEKSDINNYSLPIDKKNGYLEFDISDLKDYLINGLLLYLDDYTNPNYVNVDKYNQLTYVELIEFSSCTWITDKKLRKNIPYLIYVSN